MQKWERKNAEREPCVLWSGWGWQISGAACPISFQEGSSVPGIAQAVVIEREEDV